MSFFENTNYRKDLHIVASKLPAKNISILITGATGLIGSFMIDTLMYANQMMNRCYTIYVMGRSIEKLYERFSYALNDDNLNFIEQDVCETFNDSIDIDYIVNAASNADPYVYALYAAETILTNVIGTKNALDYATRHKKTRVLLTSTMEVYGKVGDKDINSEEDYGNIDFNMVRSGYPESKRVAELLCRSYVDEYQVSAVIARLGYIYGPTMSKTDNKVIAQFIRNILNKQDITLKSNGEQIRSYCYVADTVSGIFKVLFEGKDAEAYNIANSNSIISIREMAEVMADLGSCKVTFDLPNELEKKGFSKVQNVILDDKKLRNLGWEPYYYLRDGIEQTVRILNEYGYW